MPTGERPRGRPACGFTYLWLLFVLALGGVGLAALGELEQTRQQREREAELRFRGEAIAAALGRYAEVTPVGTLPLPQRLEELLADQRFPKPRRHLRQLYPDPFTGRADWELVIGQAALVAAADPADASPSPATPARPTPPALAASSPETTVGRGIVGLRSRSTQRLFAARSGRKTAHDWVFTPPQNGPDGTTP